MEEIYRAVTQELIRVRKAAHLTQAQVAERMHTQQASIARMERDTRGSFNLRRIADYTLACGFIPCNFCDPHDPYFPDFHCIPLEEAKQYTLANVGDHSKTMTWKNYVQWKARQLFAEMEPPQTYKVTNELSVNKGLAA
jgi:DNA-binding XRE family transcriptional regulator